jgi:hypothetical protein
MKKVIINLTPDLQKELTKLGAKLGTKSFNHTLAVACAVTDCLTESDPATLEEIRTKVAANAK